MKLTDETILEMAEERMDYDDNGSFTPGDSQVVNFARAIEATCQPQIGGVITYTSEGRGGACGQTVGADGAGEYAVVVFGTPEHAGQYATDYVRRLQNSGVRVRNFCFVSSEEGYPASRVSVVGAE